MATAFAGIGRDDGLERGLGFLERARCIEVVLVVGNKRSPFVGAGHVVSLELVDGHGSRQFGQLGLRASRSDLGRHIVLDVPPEAALELDHFADVTHVAGNLAHLGIVVASDHTEPHLVDSSDSHDVLELRHVIDGGFTRISTAVAVLNFDRLVEVVDPSVDVREHEIINADHGVAVVALLDLPAFPLFEPVEVEVLGVDTQLHTEHAAQILTFGKAQLFKVELVPVALHDAAGIRCADTIAIGVDVRTVGRGGHSVSPLMASVTRVIALLMRRRALASASISGCAASMKSAGKGSLGHLWVRTSDCTAATKAGRGRSRRAATYISSPVCSGRST